MVDHHFHLGVACEDGKEIFQMAWKTQRLEAQPELAQDAAELPAQLLKRKKPMTMTKNTGLQLPRE